MSNDNFYDRLIEEVKQLDAKREKLNKFLESEELQKKNLDSIQRVLLSVQSSAMETYSKCLRARIMFLAIEQSGAC